MYVITLIAATGGLLFGFDTGSISGALLFIRQSFALSIWQQELVVASVVLGALLSAMCSGFVADRFGRRSMLINAAILFVIGTALCSFAASVEVLVLGRFVLGLAIGISSYTVPLYISEIAPADSRGRLVLISSIAITGGQAVAFLTDYWLSSAGHWRMMLALGFIPAFVLLIGMFFLPSTPRWLVLKGRIDQAKAVMQRFGQQQCLQQLIASNGKPTSQIKFRQLFSSKMRGVLIIGVMLGVLQQFSGINTVMYYGPVIFQSAGFGEVQAPMLATFVLGLVNTVMTVVTVFTVDRFGRRNLLQLGMLVAMLSLVVVAVLFHCHQAWVHAVMLLALVAYIAGYCISLGSLFWLIIAEIYPLTMRTRAMSLVTALQWAANFVVAMTFLSILDKIGPSMTFALYACACLVALLFVRYWMPETKGVSLERIEHNVLAGKRLRDIGK